MEIKEEKTRMDGGFSTVFFDIKEGKAYKLFKSYIHPDRDKDFKDEKEYNHWRKNVFKTEKDAYEIIEGFPSILQKNE
jgi:hypothetical protein